MNGPTITRIDLAAVRQQLLAERQRLQGEITTLDIAEAALSAAQRTEGGIAGDAADIASDLVEQVVDEAVERTARRRLEEIDLALRRLESGHYGQCEECGDPIDPARLHALPWARRCLDCQRRMEYRAGPRRARLRAS